MAQLRVLPSHSSTCTCQHLCACLVISEVPMQQSYQVGKYVDSLPEQKYLTLEFAYVAAS